MAGFVKGYRRDQPPALAVLPGAPAASYQGAGLLSGSYGQASTTSRASAKVVVNGAGNLTAVGNNAPGVEALGLLTEASHTNLYLSSDTFAGNGFQQCSLVSGVPGPDGGATSGFKLVEDATNSQKNTYVFITCTTAVANGRVGTVVVKAGTRSWVYLWQNGSGTTRVWFNLATGTVGSADAGVTGSIVPVGNGWYACTANFGTAGLFPNGTPTPFICSLATGDGVSSYQGDGVSYAYLGVADFIEKPYPQSHVASLLSAATGATDVVSLSSAPLPVATGSVSFDLTPQWSAGFAGVKTVFDARNAGTSNSGLCIYAMNDTLNVITATAAASSTTSSGALSWTARQRYRVRATWGGGVVALYRDDVLVASTASGANMPAGLGANLYLGVDNAVSGPLDGWLSNLVFTN